MGNQVTAEPKVFENKIILTFSEYHKNLFEKIFTEENKQTLKSKYDNEHFKRFLSEDCVIVNNLFGDTSTTESKIAQLLGLQTCQYNENVDTLVNSWLVVPANTLWRLGSKKSLKYIVLQKILSIEEQKKKVSNQVGEQRSEENDLDKLKKLFPESFYTHVYQMDPMTNKNILFYNSDPKSNYDNPAAFVFLEKIYELEQNIINKKIVQ
jgi:hypothetical protein